MVSDSDSDSDSESHVAITAELLRGLQQHVIMFLYITPPTVSAGSKCGLDAGSCWMKSSRGRVMA